MLNKHSNANNSGDGNIGEPVSLDSVPADPCFDDAVLAELERELKDSAERLGELSPDGIFTRLASEAARRRRLRIIRQGGAASAVVLLLATGWLGAGRWSRSEPGQPPVAHVDRKTEDSISQVSISPPANTVVAAPSADHPTVSASMLSNAHRGAKLTKQIQAAAMSNKVGIPTSVSEPVPVLVHMTQSDGQVIVSPGMIVPEHTERLDWSQLGPEERRAVWKVLNLDSESSNSEFPAI